METMPEYTGGQEGKSLAGAETWTVTRSISAARKMLVHRQRAQKKAKE